MKLTCKNIILFNTCMNLCRIERRCRNFLFMDLPVVHRPHQRRPWKQLKYKNPLKYYWLKFTRGLDKI